MPIHNTKDIEIAKSPLKATIWKDETSTPFSYVVEVIDTIEDEGAIFLTRFYEPQARERAEEYARAKYSKLEIR